MNLVKKFIPTFLLAQCLIINLLTIQPVKAQVNLWGENNVVTCAFNNIGFKEQDPRQIVVNIIKIVLGFLGTIAVVLIIYAGFMWMTAGGKPDNVAKAQKIISAAVIGLIIILASYALTMFITKALSNAMK